MTFKKILVAVDSDPLAAHATDTGIDLARSLKAELAFVHVVDPSLIYGADAGPLGPVFDAQEHRDASGIFAAFRARLPAGTAALEFIRDGVPSAELTKTAAEWGADLIVIGSHGRRGISRALLGSVAEAVVRHAHSPVLVVRSDTPAPRDT